MADKAELAARATLRFIRKLASKASQKGVWCPVCRQFHDGPRFLGFVGPRDLMELHEDREDIFFDIDNDGWRRHRMVSR